MRSISDLVLFSTLFVLWTFTIAASDSHWWYSPCTADPIRHSRHITDSAVEVKRQLRIFVKQLDLSIDKLTKLYRNHSTFKPKPFGKFKCLRVIRAMEKEISRYRRQGQKGQTKMLEKFYTILQRIASMIQLLTKQKVEIEGKHFFDQDERKRIYINITFQMRNLLCEVSESSGSRVKNKVQYTPSQQCTYSDLIFLKRIRKFFRKCQRLIH